MRQYLLLYLPWVLISLQQSAGVAMAQTDAAAKVAKRPRIQPLPNVYRLHEKVLSGGRPKGKAGFEALQELGVSTVLCVDKARPEVALAKKYGLRYVHLPQSYDGVPEARARELAKAVSELPGVIYFHCEYGKPRGPAAAAIACIGVGLISVKRGEEILTATGASKDFRGLYRSVKNAVRYDNQQLRKLQVAFPEVADPPPIAEVMVRVSRSMKNLKLIADSAWQTPKAHPKLVPRSEALLLRDHFVQLLRIDDVKQQPQEFRDILQHSLATTLTLEQQLLRTPKDGFSADGQRQLTGLRSTIRQDCKSCHAKYRDN